MLNRTVVSIFAGAFLLLGMQAHAGIITLTPSTDGMIAVNIDPPKNCEPTCVYDAFGLDEDDGILELLYKSELPKNVDEDQTADQLGNDEGKFLLSYSTYFSNTPADPSDATITWLDGAFFISCPSCYLAIKDGKTTPSYYFFNLSNIPLAAASGGAQTPIWNGQDTIQLTGFWPGAGAISHVSIWGREEGNTTPGGDINPVPEPTTLGLLGLGMLALGAIRRRKVALKG